MRLRRATTAADIEQVRQAAVTDRQNAAKHRSIAEAVEAEKGELAELEASGGIGSEEAAARFAELTDKARRHAGEAERLTLVAAKRDQHIEEIERTALRDAATEAAATWREASEEQARASGAFYGRPSTSRAALEKARAKTVAAAEAWQTAAAAYTERTGEQLHPPALVDEPEWPDAKPIAEMLLAGPQQPLAEAAEAQRRAEAQHALSRRAAMRQALVSLRGIGPNPHGANVEFRRDVLAQLPDDEARAEVTRRADAEYAAASERRRENMLRERTIDREIHQRRGAVRKARPASSWGWLPDADGRRRGTIPSGERATP